MTFFGIVVPSVKVESFLFEGISSHEDLTPEEQETFDAISESTRRSLEENFKGSLTIDGVIQRVEVFCRSAVLMATHLIDRFSEEDVVVGKVVVNLSDGTTVTI